MSAVGDAYDNALAESFVATLERSADAPFTPACGALAKAWESIGARRTAPLRPL